MEADEVVENILLHLYNSTVIGSINSTALILGMKNITEVNNPRYADLKKLHDLLGADGRRLFYAAVCAIAEFAVYRALDFLENYNRFDSQTNQAEYPRLYVFYSDVIAGAAEAEHLMITKFGSEELGKRFKEIAKSKELRSLVEEVINKRAGT